MTDNIITDIVSKNISELSDSFPYIKQIYDIYKIAKKKRMEYFLKGLSNSYNCLTLSQQDYFKQLLESDEGQAILSDYADSVINTTSKTASIAFALLFSDVEHQLFEKSFKTLCILSLKGITEELIDLFLVLSKNCNLLISDKDNIYPIYFCTQDFILKSIEINSKFQYTDILLASMNDLIQRRLFAHDFGTRLASEDIQIPFGIGNTSLQFYYLLTEAKKVSIQIES